MNERPTPETDAAVVASNGQWSFVLKATCERLERERDEALEEKAEVASLREKIKRIKAQLHAAMWHIDK